MEEYDNSIRAIYIYTIALKSSRINELFYNFGYKIWSLENYEIFIRKTTSRKQIKLNPIFSDNDSNLQASVSLKAKANRKVVVKL